MTPEEQLADLTGSAHSHLNTDPTKSLEQARAALDLATAEELSEQLPKVHYLIGAAHRAIGDFPEALEHLSKSAEMLEAAGIIGNLAIVLSIRADILMVTGQLDLALEDARRARRLHQEDDDPLGAARALNVIGNLIWRKEDLVEALATYEQARAELPSEGRTMNLAGLIDQNRANVLSDLCRPDEAERLYARCVEQFTADGQTLLAREARYNWGCMLVTAGRWQEAFSLLGDLRPNLTEHADKRLLALVNLALAELRLRLDLLREAELEARDASSAFGDLSMGYERSKSEFVRGVALSRSNVEGAREALTRALEGFRAEGNRPWQALSRLRLGALELDEDPAVAVGAARDALAIAEACRAPMVTVQARELEAQGALHSGDLEGALAASEAAAAALPGSPTPWMRETVHHTRGLIERARGNVEGSIESFRDSIREIERSRACVASDDLAVSFLGSRIQVFEDLVGVHLQRSADGDVEHAFNIAGRAKAAALARLLYRDRPPDEAEHSGGRVDSMRSRLNSIYGQLVQLGSTADPSRARLEELLDEARREEERLTEHLRALPAPEPGTLSDGGSLEPATLLECMEPDATLIEYFSIGDEVVAFVLNRKGLRAIRLERRLAQLGMDVHILQFHVDRLGDIHPAVEARNVGEDSDLDAALQKLHEHLLSPLEEHLDDGPIYVAPTGALHNVPFHALNDGEHAVIDRHEVCILPSRAVLSWTPARRDTTAGPVAFGVEAPDLPAVDGELEALSGSLEEISIRRGQAATVDEFHRLAPEASLIHIASHAQFRQDNPMFSMIHLDDGGIAAWELARLRLNARIVTLSACSTGKVRPAPGDEVLGLSRGLMAAGAPTLILSQWRVSDEATAQLMRSLYRYLGAGEPARRALHRAVLDTREEYPHPYYWGPFTVFGKPRSRVA